jgi:hypothetical protein
MGNTFYGPQGTWRLKTPNGNKDFGVYAVLKTPAFITSYEGDVTGASLDVSVFTSPPKFNDRIQVKVRTSWLEPLSLLAGNKKSNWSVKAIPGGRVLTLTGAQHQSYFYSDNVTDSFAGDLPSDMEFNTWYFSIYNADSGSWGSYNPECAKHGVFGSSSTAYGSGNSYFNPSTKSLDTNYSGAAFDTEGKPVRGEIRMQFSPKYASCQWPESKFGKAKGFKAELVDGKGKKIPAKVKVSKGKKLVTISVTGFSFGEETNLKIRRSKN